MHGLTSIMLALSQIIFEYSIATLKVLLYVTLHEKTKHNTLITDFELRLPLPTTTFELLILQI